MQNEYITKFRVLAYGINWRYKKTHGKNAKQKRERRGILYKSPFFTLAALIKSFPGILGAQCEENSNKDHSHTRRNFVIVVHNITHIAHIHAPINNLTARTPNVDYRLAPTRSTTRSGESGPVAD